LITRTRGPVEAGAERVAEDDPPETPWVGPRDAQHGDRPGLEQASHRRAGPLGRTRDPGAEAGPPVERDQAPPAGGKGVDLQFREAGAVAAGGAEPVREPDERTEAPDQFVVRDGALVPPDAPREQVVRGGPREDLEEGLRGEARDRRARDGATGPHDASEVLGAGPAQPRREDGPELARGAHAHEQLAPEPRGPGAFDTLGDQHAVHPVAVGVAGQHPLELGRDRRGVVLAERDAPLVGLVHHLGRDDLQHDATGAEPREGLLVG
jgi:hypothetical protein